jgi:hypothetical protein
MRTSSLRVYRLLWFRMGFSAEAVHGGAAYCVGFVIVIVFRIELTLCVGMA